MCLFLSSKKTLNFNTLNDTQRDTTLKKEGKKDSQKTDLTKNATKKTRATLVVFKIDGRRRQRREEAASDERRRAQPGERESGKVTVERRPGRRAECGACLCVVRFLNKRSTFDEGENKNALERETFGCKFEFFFPILVRVDTIPLS